MLPRKLALFPITVLLLLSLTSSVCAHPGGTDENGGHTDKDSGEYHYHHGYPAHDHYDMDGDGKVDCPYDFDDQTGKNSGTTTDKQTAVANNSNNKGDNYEDSHTDAAFSSTTKKHQQADIVHVDSLRITLSFACVLFVTGIFLSFITFQNDNLRRWIKALISIVVLFTCLFSFAGSLLLTDSVFYDYIATPAYLITSVIVGLTVFIVFYFDLYDKLKKLNAFIAKCLLHVGILYILFFAGGVLLSAFIISILPAAGFFLYTLLQGLYCILQVIVESIDNLFTSIKTKKLLKVASNLLSSIESSNFPSCASDILYELKKQIISNSKVFRKPFEPAIQSAMYAIVSKRLECKSKTVSKENSSPIFLQLLLIHYRLHNILKKSDSVSRKVGSTKPDYGTVDKSSKIQNSTAPKKEEIYMLEDVSGMIVRVQASKLSGWQSAQNEIKKHGRPAELTEVEKNFKEDLLRRIYAPNPSDE